MYIYIYIYIYICMHIHKYVFPVYPFSLWEKFPVPPLFGNETVLSMSYSSCESSDSLPDSK